MNILQFPPGYHLTFPLEIRHYGEADSRYLLYDDDGETFGYEQGACTWIELEAARNGSGRMEGRFRLKKKGFPSPYRPGQWRFMTGHTDS